MKRGILLVLIGLLLVSTLVGCNTYRRHVVTTPDTNVTQSDGTRAATRGGFRYRTDGQVVDGRTHRRTHGHYAHRGHYGAHSYRHDGRVTDTDGIIGDGTHADRPADGRHATRRAVERMGDGVRDGVRNAGERVADGSRWIDGTTGAYRSDLVAR